MTGCATAINFHIGGAGNNNGSAAMPIVRATDCIAYAGHQLAINFGGGRASQYNAAVICFVANNN